MTYEPPDLTGSVALVAGATRGAGRGIARELGASGATVYVTGRTSKDQRSPMNRKETIEETASLVDDVGGTGIPVRVDHSIPEDVSKLVRRIEADQGRLDVVVNDVWGGDPLTQWDVPFWQHDLGNGLTLLHQAVDTHLITAWYTAPLLKASSRGLLVEVTDGIGPEYRGSLFYDLAKASVLRIAKGMAVDLHPSGVAVIAVTPGFLRSEAVLDHFGVTEDRWRDGIASDPHFAASETPHYIGRAVAALAADRSIFARTGTATATWRLAKEYGFEDIDGTQPDWAAYARTSLGWRLGET